MLSRWPKRGERSFRRARPVFLPYVFGGRGPTIADRERDPRTAGHVRLRGGRPGHGRQQSSPGTGFSRPSFGLGIGHSRRVPGGRDRCSDVHRSALHGTITNNFAYDVLGRKILQVDPDTGTTAFQYNALGELIAQTDNGGYRTEREIDGEKVAT